MLPVSSSPAVTNAPAVPAAGADFIAEPDRAQE